MKADHFSQNDALAFPLSLTEETVGPEVNGPSRFATALKQARFRKGWTQAKLAAQLSISKRSIVSWETAERIPSIGMVILLLDALLTEEELSLHREMITAYIVDDLERLQRRKDLQRQQDDPFLQRVQRMIERVLQLPARSVQARPSKEHRVAEERMVSQWEEREPFQPQQVGEQQALEPLFTLMAQLHQHPELIPVARDFIRELAPGE
jgi:transcriptional regulator with XRE-family HTH domain